MSDATRFWDRAADGYARKRIKDPESYERTLDATRKYLGPKDRALELGCGTGTTALRLAASVAEYVATDVSPRMLEIAREKAERQDAANLRFEAARAAAALCAPGSCDVVLAFNLLHLLDDLTATLERIHAQLRPGGCFVSKTPCLGDASRLFGPLLALLRILGIAPPVERLQARALEAALVATGFEIVESTALPAGSNNRFLVARKA